MLPARSRMLPARAALDPPRVSRSLADPTIKYFTADSPATGSDYGGGRSFDDLKSFVAETLEVKCLLADDSGCSDKEKEFMGKWKAKDKAEVTAQLERLSKMVGGTMAPDLKKWVAQRINVLKQLSEA